MDERPHEPPRYPLPQVIQPDPVLEPDRNLFGSAMVYLGAAAIVVLVLYGLTRPEGPQQQMANTPSTTGQGAPHQGSGNDQAKEQAKPGAGQAQPARSDSSNDTGSKNQPRQ